jgi:hypothetical protein
LECGDSSPFLEGFGIGVKGKRPFARLEVCPPTSFPPHS